METKIYYSREYMSEFYDEQEAEKKQKSIMLEVSKLKLIIISTII